MILKFDDSSYHICKLGARGPIHVVQERVSLGLSHRGFDRVVNLLLPSFTKQLKNITVHFFLVEKERPLPFCRSKQLQSKIPFQNPSSTPQSCGGSQRCPVGRRETSGIGFRGYLMMRVSHSPRLDLKPIVEMAVRRLERLLFQQRGAQTT